MGTFKTAVRPVNISSYKSVSSVKSVVKTLFFVPFRGLKTALFPWPFLL